jgi:YD repeat-containing protein
MKNVLWFFAFYALNSYAGVHLRNGNYFDSYTDLITISKGVQLELSRTYNSTSTYSGWFGFGWGSLYESSIETSADGTIVLNEGGSGSTNRFIPDKLDDEAVNKIIAGVVAVKGKKIPADKEKLVRDRLLKDAKYRLELSVKYKVTPVLKVGETISSVDFSAQKITITDIGYKRVTGEGITQNFNKIGKLVSTKNLQGYGLDFIYNKANQVEKITDTAGNQFLFEWYGNGKVKKVTTQDKKSTTYEYNGEDLVRNVDFSGAVFNYKYDVYHNLVSVEDATNKKKTLIDYEITNVAKVSKVVFPGGESSEYAYLQEDKKDSTKKTTLVSRNENGNVSCEKYDFKFSKNKKGVEYLSEYGEYFDGSCDLKKKTYRGGTPTISFYEEGIPSAVRKIEGEREIVFSYNKDLQVTKRVDKEKGKILETTSYEYDPKFKKVSKVTKGKGVTVYDYNNSGELSKVLSSQGSALLLTYNSAGYITKMLEQNNKSKGSSELGFSYNSKGRVTKVEVPPKGQLEIFYDKENELEVLNVKASDPSLYKYIKEMTAKYDELMRPAGVNFSF